MKLNEEIGDLGQEPPPESPLAKLGHQPPPPEELEPEEGEFDPREYMATGLDLGAYLEPVGFARRDDVRDGVTVYTLHHTPLATPIKIRTVEDGQKMVKFAHWANLHVRFDAVAAIPFWRVLVSPGDDTFYYPHLQMARIVRLDPDTAEDMEWVPEAVAAVKSAMDIVSQPSRQAPIFIWKLKEAGFKPFSQ